MSLLVVSASTALIEAAKRVLESEISWPQPATGLAHRIFTRAGTSLPRILSQPLRETSATLLRRTPEIAAYGYVLDRADASTVELWTQAVEHLRGREIYPPDRQSFIFNPTEILGVATGLASPAGTTEHREWFANTILRGMIQGQFRTPLSRLAAHAALSSLDNNAASQQLLPEIEITSLGVADLTLAATISFASGVLPAPEAARIERALLTRALTHTVPIGDAADAATLIILAQRAVDEVALGPSESTALERIIALCRRFPLFIERIQSRQRSRPPFPVDDEYDVQDLLYAILRLHFDDVRPEEVTPTYAGNASRVDFFLPREKIIVEAKMTRSGLGQKEVVNQLVIDIARYAQMPTVDTLICIVYDPEHRCTHPTALKNDIESGTGRLNVRVVVCPQGL